MSKRSKHRRRAHKREQGGPQLVLVEQSDWRRIYRVQNGHGTVGAVVRKPAAADNGYRKATARAEKHSNWTPGGWHMERLMRDLGWSEGDGGAIAAPLSDVQADARKSDDEDELPVELPAEASAASATAATTSWWRGMHDWWHGWHGGD